jgi:Putative adhesin
MDATVKMPATGSVEADIDFGDFTINDLSGQCDLYLQYGDFEARNLSHKNNIAHVAFGNARINNWGGGEFGVQYGDAKITEVDGDLDLKVQFGDACIDNLSSSCKQLSGHVEYGDLKIKLGSGFGGSFEAEASYGDVELPTNAKYTSKQKDFSGSNKSGTIGSGSSVLKIDVSFGDVEIE